MTVRSLAIDIATRADTSAIQEANTQTDNFKESTSGATEEVYGLETSTSRFGDTAGRVGRFVEENALKIGAAFAGAGAGLEGLIRSQQELELETQNVAIAMDTSSDEVRDMVSNVTDFTFSAEDAVSGAQRLIQSNIDNKETIEELLPVFDTFSDATGKDMVEGIDAFYAAFSALNIPLTEAEEHLDTMVWLQNETRVEMSDLQNVTRRFAPELKDMNVEVDELAVLLAAMEEAGMGGPKMMTHLREAFNEGHESIDGVYESVGLTNEVLENQEQRLAGAEGSAEKYAEANKENITWLQQKHQELMNTSHAYGGLIQNLDFLSPALMFAGTMVIALANAKNLLSGTMVARAIPAMYNYLRATRVARIGSMLLGGALRFMLGPIGLVITAVSLIALGIVHLWNTNEGFRNFVIGAWETIQTAIGTAIEWASERVDYFRTKFDEIISFFSDIDLYDIGRNILSSLIEGITSMVGSLTDSVKNIGGTIKDGITGFFGMSSPSTLMMEYGGNISEGLGEGIEGKSGHVEHSIERITERAIPQAGRRPAEPAQPSFVVNIENIEAGEGTSGEGIARSVERELESMMERYWKRMQAKMRAGEA